MHHNLRVAYVSQHAFFHIENHLEDAPAAYIQWRFKDAYDKEKINSEAFRISPEEQQRIDDFCLEAIWSRRMRAGKLEYEIKKKDIPERDNKVSRKDDFFTRTFCHYYSLILCHLSTLTVLQQG